MLRHDRVDVGELIAGGLLEEALLGPQRRVSGARLDVLAGPGRPAPPAPSTAALSGSER